MAAGFLVSYELTQKQQQIPPTVLSSCLVSHVPQWERKRERGRALAVGLHRHMANSVAELD